MAPAKQHRPLEEINSDLADQHIAATSAIEAEDRADDDKAREAAYKDHVAADKKIATLRAEQESARAAAAD